MFFSIVIPCFNEKENILNLVKDIIEVLHFKKIEIIIVDDHSPDGTYDIVKKQYSLKDPVVRIFYNNGPKGLAYSIRHGIERASGDAMIVMDSDFNHPPEYLDLFCCLLECERVDLVLGSRFLLGGSSTRKMRYFFSFFYNAFINFFTGNFFSDNLSGFFGIKKKKLDELDLDKIFWGYGDYYFRLLNMTQKRNYYHVQIPIRYGKRQFGESKTKFFSIFFKYTYEVFMIFLRNRKEHLWKFTKK